MFSCLTDYSISSAEISYYYNDLKSSNAFSVPSGWNSVFVWFSGAISNYFICMIWIYRPMSIAFDDVKYILDRSSARFLLGRPFCLFSGYYLLPVHVI